MKVFVKFEAYPITGADAVASLREAAKRFLGRVHESGRMESGGGLTTIRGGFLVLTVDSAEELLELLGGDAVDNFKVEIHPVVPFSALGDYFSRHPPGTH